MTLQATGPEVQDDVEPTLNEGEEFATLEDPTPEVPEKTAPAAAPAPAEDTDGLPPELLKRTPRELAKMYRDAHQVIGRQGRELGELRQLADSHLKASLVAQTRALQAPAAAPKPKVDDVDPDTQFFAKPVQTMDERIANHPEVKALREANLEAQAERAATRKAASETRFVEKHPDFQTVMADPKLQEWVGASPIRQTLLLKAHADYDFTAGDEVFSLWKALQAVPAQRADAAAAKKKAVSAARVPSGNASPTANAAGKIYRRADLIKLQLDDPSRYMDLAPEIERAYAENRVR